MIERPDVFETVKTKSDFDKLIKDANAGEPKAEFLLGECYRTGHFINYSNSSALKWYTLAAEHGCAIAQDKVGRYYLYGRGVEKNQAEGLKWIRFAAMQGYVAAQLSLAIAYDCGNGVEQNYEEALTWFKQAAKHGDTQAQIRIGEFYYNGLGVEQNYEEAVKYFRLAGDRAIDKLADCYLRGHGVEQSVEKAIELLKSNALGNQSLCMKLAHLYSDGSPDLDKRVLGDVVDLFTNMDMGDTEESKDLLGRTYEYCIQQFAAYEGVKGGEFYTPASILVL